MMGFWKRLFCFHDWTPSVPFRRGLWGEAFCNCVKCGYEKWVNDSVWQSCDMIRSSDKWIIGFDPANDADRGVKVWARRLDDGTVLVTDIEETK